MTVLPAPHTHCHACGAAYGAYPPPPQPRVCRRCQTVKWWNPTPISVLLQPVDCGPGAPLGLLVTQRGISPCKGGWALPGGFVELGDQNYETAAVREKTEEIVFSPGVTHNSGAGTLLFSLPGDPGQIISFVEAENPMSREQTRNILASEETLMAGVARGPVELCFRSHTEAMRRWFALARRAV